MSVSVSKTTSGWIVKDTDADNTVEKDVLAGPGRLCHVHMTNPNAAVCYLKIFNHINPTLGTTDPDEIYECPGSGTEGGILDLPINPSEGLLFSEGISYACVTAAGTAGTTSPTANVTVVLQLKPGSE